MATSLRDRALRFTPFREKTVTVSVPTPGGEKEDISFLLKQPSVAQRNRILAEIQNGRKGDVDAAGIGKSQALAVILCALDPETREAVFTEADLDALLALPAGGWLDDLSGAAMGLMSDAEQAAKT